GQQVVAAIVLQHNALIGGQPRYAATHRIGRGRRGILVKFDLCSQRCDRRRGSADEFGDAEWCTSRGERKRNIHYPDIAAAVYSNSKIILVRGTVEAERR